MWLTCNAPFDSSPTCFEIKIKICCSVQCSFRNCCTILILLDKQALKVNEICWFHCTDCNLIASMPVFFLLLHCCCSTDEECRIEEEDERLDSERQILLTMLLAQVCAQQDATPVTFISQVLRLYELKVLDTIQFLYDLGFVQRPVLSRLAANDRAAEVSAVRAAMESAEPIALSGTANRGNPAFLGASRYLRDFDELALIAGGAFGDVYRTRHR
jgi:hypothetical protein